MAVKDFKVEAGQKAIVVNADGRMWRVDGNLPEKVKSKMILGTDSFPNELGEPILHIWVD